MPIELQDGSRHFTIQEMDDKVIKSVKIELNEKEKENGKNGLPEA